MDAFELFKKLRTGVKFDCKRFESDALRFQIIKSKLQPSSASSQDAPVKKPSMDESQISDSPGKKRKRKNRKKSEADVGIDTDQDESDFDDEIKSDEGEEEDITLSTSLPQGTSLKNIKKRRKAKKKKVTMQKLAEMKKEQINHFRKQNHIYAFGEDIPDPLETFAQLVTDYNVHEDILSNIMSLGYTTPTSIQMQAVPIMIHRREILACAPTGSGKTAAFLIPILHHLKEPRRQGFRALIVEPTRELAKQVYRECCRLAQGRKFRIHMIDKTDKAMKKFGPDSSQKFDILITTPNRLLYLLQKEQTAIDLKNVEWLIVDESDKLFEEGKKGFRDQLAAIYKACSSTNVRRAMFSATYACDVEEWCKLNLDNVVAVSVGARNSAVDTVIQELKFVGSESGKLVAFRDLVRAGLPAPVLVFVQSKERAKELFSELIYDGINVEVIHADRTQLQRDNVIKAFRAGKIWVLICTELMGRGIDFKGVNLVVNYDFPPSAISYIHRIGRTGRAGRQGKAITFFTENDSVNLRSVAQVMKNAGCPVPEYMLEMKKPSKKVKHLLAKRAMERDRISTVPLYDLEKAEKRRQAIKKFKKSKVKPQKDGT